MVDWDWCYCPSCGRYAYVPINISYCQFDERLLIPMATTPKRASSFAPGIGKNITSILDKDVVVAKAWIGERQFDGEPRPIVIVTLDDGEVYHAWSASLADKISEIPEDQYPLTFKFTRVETRKAGQSVITFE